jgi:hypothetical protein
MPPTEYPAFYLAHHQITPQLKLEWSLVGTDKIAFKMTRTAPGWLGLGFNPQNLGMSFLDIAIGQSFGGTVIVKDYWSEGDVQPQTDDTIGGTDNILSYRGSFTSSSSTIEFIRYLIGRDSYDNDITTNGVNKVIWAVGVTDTIAQHGPSTNDRGALYIDFITDQVITIEVTSSSTLPVSVALMVVMIVAGRMA